MKKLDEKRIREIIQEELAKEREATIVLIQKQIVKEKAAAGTAALELAIKQGYELKRKGII